MPKESEDFSLIPFLPDRFMSLFDEGRDWFPYRLSRGLTVYETDKDVVVKAEVPGVSADKVNVTYDEGVLRIKAEKQETKEEKEKQKVIYRWQNSSSFSYATTLPKAIKEEEISAEVEDGIVTVTAPIAEEAKGKKIEVKVKSK